MRKPIIFKDHCDDDLPWACCYEDDESNTEWCEGRFYIGFGKTWLIKPDHEWFYCGHIYYDGNHAAIRIGKFYVGVSY